MTETCDEAPWHVMPHVEPPEAAVSDVTMTEPIHHALTTKQLAPEIPSGDAGYGSATWRVERLGDWPMKLLGPVRPDSSWPAQASRPTTSGSALWTGRPSRCPVREATRVPRGARARPDGSLRFSASSSPRKPVGTVWAGSSSVKV